MAVNRSRCRLTLYGRSLRLLQSTGKVGRHGRRMASKSPIGENGDHFPLSPVCAIHIFHLDTQILSTIPHSEGLWSARWSPAGRYLAALTRDDKKLMLYDFPNAEVDAAGRRLHRRQPCLVRSS